MEDNKIKEGNKIIAKFDGWELINLNTDDPEDSDFDCWIFKNKITGQVKTGHDMWGYNSESTLDYDSDWNMLMSIVDKIEQTNTIQMFDNECCIFQNTTPLTGNLNNKIIMFSGIDKQEAVFKAIISFIDFKNKSLV